VSNVDVNNDFVVSVHALERFQERFPELLAEWLSERDSDEFLELSSRLEEEGELPEADKERWDEFVWKCAGQVGKLIHEETMGAFEAGRVSHIAPLEFADNDVSRWNARQSRIAWVADKSRGYVIVEGYEGMTVATVLIGQPFEQARSKLYGAKKRQRR